MTHSRPVTADAHDHDHGHDHGHDHAPEVTDQNERVVRISFLLTFGFMVVEVVGGLLSGSLALIADAGHMLTDAAALALAWAAFRLGRRAPDRFRTYGYMRSEVLAGLANAVALILLVVWIAYEAIQRLLVPHPVLAGPMLAVAAVGLVVNIVVFRMLMQGDREHVNIRGALLHVLGDLLGSVAAIVAAIVIWLTGWTPVDPILSVLLSALVLRSGWKLLTNSLHILMEGAPQGLEPERIRGDLLQNVAGVADVSHVHVWSITSGRVTATMHVTLAEGADPADTVGRLKARLAESFSLTHSTVEIDWAGANAACPLEPRSGADPHHTHDGRDHADHGHGHDQAAHRPAACG